MKSRNCGPTARLFLSAQLDGLGNSEAAVAFFVGPHDLSRALDGVSDRGRRVKSAWSGLLAYPFQAVPFQRSTSVRPRVPLS
jgi:hypothetical protein